MGQEYSLHLPIVLLQFTNLVVQSLEILGYVIVLGLRLDETRDDLLYLADSSGNLDLSESSPDLSDSGHISLQTGFQIFEFRLPPQEHMLQMPGDQDRIALGHNLLLFPVDDSTVASHHRLQLVDIARMPLFEVGALRPDEPDSLPLDLVDPSELADGSVVILRLFYTVDSLLGQLLEDLALLLDVFADH